MEEEKKFNSQRDILIYFISISFVSLNIQKMLLIKLLKYKEVDSSLTYKSIIDNIDEICKIWNNTDLNIDDNIIKSILNKINETKILIDENIALFNDFKDEEVIETLDYVKDQLSHIEEQLIEIKKGE